MNFPNATTANNSSVESQPAPNHPTTIPPAALCSPEELVEMNPLSAKYFVEATRAAWHRNGHGPQGVWGEFPCPDSVGIWPEIVGSNTLHNGHVCALAYNLVLTALSRNLSDQYAELVQQEITSEDPIGCKVPGNLWTGIRRLLQKDFPQALTEIARLPDTVGEDGKPLLNGYLGAKAAYLLAVAIRAGVVRSMEAASANNTLPPLVANVEDFVNRTGRITNE